MHSKYRAVLSAYFDAKAGGRGGNGGGIWDGGEIFELDKLLLSGKEVGKGGSTGGRLEVTDGEKVKETLLSWLLLSLLLWLSLKLTLLLLDSARTSYLKIESIREFVT